MERMRSCWSERSACDQRSALRWPLFQVINLFSSSSSYHRYSKPQKRLSQGFKFLHGPLKKNNKNSGKKIKFVPPPPGPLGGDFYVFLSFFVENFTRRSARVLKLHRGFFLTKKGDISPPKNLEAPLAPVWSVSRFF